MILIRTNGDQIIDIYAKAPSLKEETIIVVDSDFNVKCVQPISTVETRRSVIRKIYRETTDKDPDGHTLERSLPAFGGTTRG